MAGGTEQGWWDRLRAWANKPQATQRGQPAPFSPYDRRPSPLNEGVPFGGALQHQSRDYSRSAQSLTYLSGVLSYDPIGPGTFYTRQLPIHQDGIFDPNTATYRGDTGQYVEGLGIVWGSPTPINYGNNPIGGPIYTPEILAAILGPAAGNAVIDPSTIMVQPLF